MTSWKGNAVYQVTGEQVRTVAEGVPTPAQVGYDERRERVLIPVLRENELLIHPLR